MSYCSNCGQEIKAGADICLSCGKIVGGQNKVASSSDTGGLMWTVLGFFLPLIGLILYFVWKTEQPKNAASAGKGALIGVVVSVFSYIIFTILFGSILGDILYYI
jgi:heme/copper-type cytochrome/quinol oxidase subunit 2